MLAKTIRVFGVLATGLILGCSDGTNPMFNETAEVRIFSVIGTTVAAGQTLQLEGRAVTWGGERVDARINKWESQKPAITTVSNTGLVTGVAPGSTLIFASAGSVVSIGRLINVTGDGSIQ